MTQKPIFILGIQRGGTNQILNILRSHPATFWPQGEFHEVFRPRRLRKEGLGALRKLGRYAPILLTAGDILDPDARPRRARLSDAQRRAVRAGLEGSAAANPASVAAFKAGLRRQGFFGATAAPDRLLVKVMNYNLAFARDLLAIWPQARFVGVVRDGRAVCEGHIARGASVAAATAVYDFVCRQLIDLEAEGVAIRTWRFEDLLGDAAATSAAIYAFCGLDGQATRGVCLQDKERVPNAAGGVGVRKVAHYYSFPDMGRHMRADVNAGALARLPEAARAEITARCQPALRHFGYV